MEFTTALESLVLQMADDDLLVGHRASEWMGLVPHLEADVAYASIAQDELGHAFDLFLLLSDGDETRANHLLYSRPPEQRFNATLLEFVNGHGSYWESPQFDWAFSLVRHWLYDVYKARRLERLVDSSYHPLATLAAKMLDEEQYHLYHHRVWLSNLFSNPEATQRVRQALQQAWPFSGDLPFIAPWESAWLQYDLLPRADSLHSDWLYAIRDQWSAWDSPGFFTTHLFNWATNGRLGQHTRGLSQALQTMAAVRQGDDHVHW
jgi:ring-1,2-phenylacetyl-CoA epoxidase subunit PaaC